MADNIVTDWLRSLNLVHYTQAFLDNGYDDLEICKQIGSPDLDAIGVLGEDHRQRILGAVKTLREQGGTAVYFTLENPDTDGGGGGGGRQHRAHEELGPRLDDYKEGKTGLLAYPKLQLKHIIRDKLVRDDVDLSGPPYISSADQSGCRSSFMALAMKYASELKTHVEDVLDRLEELRWWKITKDVDTLSSKSLSPVRSIHSPTLYGYMPRGTPPPLPSCPPPTTSHSDRCAELEKHMKGVHLRLDTQGVSTNYTGNYIALDGGMCCVFPWKVVSDKEAEGKKKSSGLGKLFRNMGLRRSGRKYAYKQHHGDPNAYDITMSDDDRIALMVMVKEGKITTEHALEVDQFCGCRESPLMGRQGLHIRGRRQMRHDLTKPAKSQSDIYSGASPRCELCRSRSQDVEERIRWPDDRLIGDFQCSQHRRVHSIGHMEFYQSQSPEFMRSTSCSPTRGSHAENVKSPSPRCRIYSPVLYLTQGNKPVDEELLISLSPEDGKEEGAKKNETVLNKSSSGTSVESDASVECLRHGPLASEIVATRNGDLTNCSNSTVSASSETSPAIGRKPGTLTTKMRNFVLQRSNSYSTGDDGMSSDYDEQDELTMKLSQSCPRGMLARANISDKGKDLKNDLKKRILRPKEPYYKQKQVEREFRDGGPDINQGIPADFVHHCHHHQYLTSPGLTGTKTADGIPIYSGPFLGQARALFNYIPEPHKKDALTLKKGDIIHVINMVQPGLWKGLHNKKLGTFKFCHVEMITDDTPRCQRKDRIHRRRNSQRSKPRNVEELMQRIGLEHLTSIFLLNGYDKLETFVDIDEDDLNELNIRDPEQRAKLLTAAELLVDCNSPDILECAPRSDELGATPSDTPASLSPPTIFNTDPPPPMPIQPICRDSGFYASSENSIHKGIHLAKSFDEETQKKRSGQSGPDVGHTRNLKTKACQTNHTVTADSSLLTDDKELSAEDREVSEITDGFMQKDSHKLSPKIVSTLDTAQRCSSAQQASRDNVANGFISHSSSFSSMSSGCTHLSPTFHHRAKKEDQPEGDGKVTLHSSGSEGSDETHSDVSDISPHKKPKPFSQRKPGTKLSSVKINGIPAQSDRGISPSYYILSSPSLSKRDACTQFNPRSKSTFAMETQSQKTLPNNKLSETENSAHHTLSGTLGRPSGFPSEHRDSPSRSLPRPPKPPSRSLIPLLKAKLSDENIDLTQEPYSDKVGHCGVPPLLVQRYAEELRNDVWGIAAVLEQVRTTQLQLQGREGVTSESLGKACLTSCDLKISSLKDFLTSIGLPMYKEILVRSGYSSMERVLGMTDSDVSKIMRDARHTKRMLHALEWVRARLASPTRKSRMATVKDQV